MNNSVCPVNSNHKILSHGSYWGWYSYCANCSTFIEYNVEEVLGYKKKEKVIDEDPFRKTD